MFILRWIWRLFKAAIGLVLLVIAIPVIGLAYGFLTTSPPNPTPLGAGEAAPPQAVASQLRTEIKGYQRPEESTYLTYPEWAIVYAAREYARFLKGGGRESGFPYWSYVGRFWQDYAIMIRASSAYPFNFQNHQMLAVIGTSHTIEHVIQWAYESTVGAFTEWTSGKPVAVDEYQAGVAAEYAAFLDQTPWYRFPYAQKKAGLAAVQPRPDDDATRTTERKWAFGFADSVKQTYADMINSATAASAPPALLDIYVWATGPVALAIADEADTKIDKDLGVDGAVFVTRRYQAFSDMIPRLIGRGIRFVEIGGNDEIMATFVSSGPVTAPPGTRLLFSYPLPADPARQRTGLTLGVAQMHLALPALQSAGAQLEHVYDY